MSPTPWSWQKPPLPESYSVPRYTYSVPPSKIWNRSLWGMEPYYALCSYYQPGFTDVLCSCQLSAQSASNDKVLSLNTLRAAICLLRHQRPNIASRLAFSALASGQPPCEKDVHLVYETVTAEEEIERWVSEVVRDRSAVFDDAGSMQSAVDHVMREVGSGFSSLPTTLFNVYYIVAPDRREAALVVRGSHVVFDAFGLTTCLNQLIANMALIVGNSRDVEELVWGEEVGRLVGPGIEYATIPWSPEQAEEDKAMLRRAVEVAKGVKSTSGITIQHPSAAPTTTSVFVRTLSSDTLRRILTAARAHGCTFYPALFAAMVVALLRVNPPVVATPNLDGLAVPVLFTPVNLRKRGFITRDDDVLYALSYNVVVAKDLGRFVPSTSPSDDVWTIGKEVYAQMQEQQDDVKRVSIWGNDFLSNLMSMMLKGGRTQPQGLQKVVTPRLSSVGVIDGYLATHHDIQDGGAITISNPIITVSICSASPILGYMTGVHAYTWNKTAYICFSFPEAFMGTLDEQKERSERNGGSRTDTILDWSEEFMKILQDLGKSDQLPN